MTRMNANQDRILYRENPIDCGIRHGSPQLARARTAGEIYENALVKDFGLRASHMRNRHSTLWTTRARLSERTPLI